MFNHTLKDLENIYKNIAGFDMSFYNLTDLCRNAREEDFINRYIDRSKRKDEKKYCV